MHNPLKLIVGAAMTTVFVAAASFALPASAQTDESPAMQPGQTEQQQPGGGMVQQPPAGGMETQPGMSAPQQKMHEPQGQTKGSRMEQRTSPENVEARVKSLHAKLRITKAQEQDWDAVAQVMRDNAKAIHDLIMERRANEGQMSAIDDLDSYEKIAREHADGIQRLIPVFTTLYQSMSDDQKKNADRVFGRYEGHRRPAKMKSSK